MIPQTMTHKILARAAGRDHVVAGEIVEVGIDMAFTHDPVCEGLRREFRDAFGPDARDAILAGAAAALPGGRVGRADEVGEAIAFLLGNGFMNGEILHIDGGGRLV